MDATVYDHPPHRAKIFFGGVGLKQPPIFERFDLKFGAEDFKLLQFSYRLVQMLGEHLDRFILGTHVPLLLQRCAVCIRPIGRRI